MYPRGALAKSPNAHRRTHTRTTIQHNKQTNNNTKDPKYPFYILSVYTPLSNLIVVDLIQFFWPKHVLDFPTSVSML